MIVNKSKFIEILLEGKLTCLIEDGKFAIAYFKKDGLAQDEFFTELKLQSISHLGQVKLAIIETSGNISVFYYEDIDVKYGLPILPSLFCNKSTLIKQNGYYSCSFCGYTNLLEIDQNAICKVCNKNDWVKSLNIKRTT